MWEAASGNGKVLRAGGLSVRAMGKHMKDMNDTQQKDS
jgi:hypothetical protein